MFASFLSLWNRPGARPTSRSSRIRRRVLELERLDTRYALANDLGAMVSSQAEGEPAPDLVAFAKILAADGIRLFGADWAQEVANQLSIFQDGARYLNYVEVTNGDRNLNSQGVAENITVVPTWKAATGGTVEAFLSLQDLVAQTGLSIPLSSKPSFFPIESQRVKLESPLHVPVDAYDPNGNPLTITVTSSHPENVTASVLQGNPSARITVDGYGEMIFQLFQSEAPRPVNRFTTLAQNGFYNTTSSTSPMTFHRASPDFVIQGGDPSGTGTGGSTLGQFDDQYNLNLQHNRSGVLSYAKSLNDTNDSQFFVTAGEARGLDYNHSVFGQLIEGDRVRAGINRVAIGPREAPAFPIVIRSIEIFNDTENGLLRLNAVGIAGSTSEITVTVTDTEGNQSSQVFSVTVDADDADGAPFFGDISDGTQFANRPITLQLTAREEEGDPPWYWAVVPSGTPIQVDAMADSGDYRITPNQDFVGRASFFVVVARNPIDFSDLDNAALYDSQLVNIDFVAPFSMSINRPSIFEGDGPDQAATVTVTRPDIATSTPLEIRLSASDATRLNIPASITIEANRTSATFEVRAINGTQVEGLRQLTVAGEAADYAVTVDVNVYDDDTTSRWFNASSPFNVHDVDNDGGLGPTDVLVVINQLLRSGTVWLPSLSPTISRFVDTNNDYYVSPIDVLKVINELNRRSRSNGEGEGSEFNAHQSSALSLWLIEELDAHRNRRTRG